MKTLISTAIQWSPHSSSKSTNKLLLRPRSPSRFSCSFGLEGHGNAEISQSSNGGDDKQTEIWKYFKEAQQNIMYLNKQRVKAVDELNRVNQENHSLRETVIRLEAERKLSRFGEESQKLCWELLLRIDSLVLTGTIGNSEASDLRRLIMDRRVGLHNVFSDVREGNDVEFLEALRQFSNRSTRTAFHVVHICTEMEPLVSVGCLGSYVTGLSQALQRKGHLVEVILPKYENLDLEAIQELREIDADCYSYFNGQLHKNKIWNGIVSGIGVTLIEPRLYSSFFNRERIYGYSDDFERFSYFSRASLDYIFKSGKRPDILHIHNWETAITGPLFWDVFENQGLEGTKILFTCQDLNLQCVEKPEKIALCGLDPLSLHRADRLQDSDKTHLVNLLKGGIVYANKVVVMSSMNSKSKIIQSLSHGLESTLNVHKDKIVVSPFGFESSTWDPLTDNTIPKNYTADDITGKATCKISLQNYTGLSENASTILVACILSDVSEVDLELLKAEIQSAIIRGVQFIIIGDENLSNTNRGFQSFQEELQDDNIKFILQHDETISHLIFAGSDIILCQSYHDPVFQAPLKALRYGAAPLEINSNKSIFRSFVDHDIETNKFSRFISSTFRDISLSEALDEIEKNSSKWNRKISKGMKMDFSWDDECCDIHISTYAELKNL